MKTMDTSTVISEKLKKKGIIYFLKEKLTLEDSWEYLTDYVYKIGMTKRSNVQERLKEYYPSTLISRRGSKKY
jgi:hypothetical protein